MSQASSGPIKVKKNNFLAKDTQKNEHGLLSHMKSTTPTDIIEKLRITQKQPPQLNYTISSTKKPDAGFTQLKNQIDLIKNTCEAQLN